MSLARLAPSAPLTVRSVPPQLMRLFALMYLEPVKVRADEQLLDVLPAEGPAWIKETLSAQAPELTLPNVLPPAGGMMMVAMLRLSEAGTVFPLQKPRELLAMIEQATASYDAHLAPQIKALAEADGPGLRNMASVARFTLALRAKGICLTTLTEVDVLPDYADSARRVKAVLKFASDMSDTGLQPFKLSEGQLSLAQKLAWLASYKVSATLSGLPPLSDPRFIDALKSQVDMLAALPTPSSSLLPDQIRLIAELDVILEAFGEDALTSKGVARVNALLDALAKMKIAIPNDARSLADKLIETPAREHVSLGKDAVETAGAAIAASAAVSAPKTFGTAPILFHLERMTTLSEILEKALGKPSLGLCNACQFPIDDIAARLADVSVPEVPPELLGSLAGA